MVCNPHSASNVVPLQGISPQSSSLMNMPLSLTDGDWMVRNPAGISSESLGCGVTSAHHSQGDTPSIRDSSIMPYMVP